MQYLFLTMSHFLMVPNIFEREFSRIELGFFRSFLLQYSTCTGHGRSIRNKNVTGRRQKFQKIVSFIVEYR